MISFVTCIKLGAGYEDYGSRCLRLYVESIYEASFLHEEKQEEYEILIVEEEDTTKNKNKNNLTLSEEWLLSRGARVIKYGGGYANPYGYSMIEAFAKNVGIRAAKYEYICVTNCDIMVGRNFFAELLLEPNVFYRFLQYETLEKCWTTEEGLAAPCKCLNEELLDETKWTLNAVANKSGDIMLMDAGSWRKIGGFPENEVWVHSDLIVCKVVHNNGIKLKVNPNVRVLTWPQEKHAVGTVRELLTSYAYYNAVVCNPCPQQHHQNFFLAHNQTPFSFGF